MLFTKDIDKKLFQQYELGSNLEKQKVIAKIFNPYSEGRWFLINSDPQDPDYLWAIVQMGDTVEVGSVSRKALETARVGRFRFPLERDLGFSPVNAAELFRGLNQGKFYADGGETEVEEEQTVTRGFYEDEPYEYSKGGGVDRYKNFHINSEGNYAANVNGKNYEIIYRDDISKMYDLFEDGKKINSSKSVRDVMKFSDGGYMAKGGKTKGITVSMQGDSQDIKDIKSNLENMSLYEEENVSDYDTQLYFYNLNQKDAEYIKRMVNDNYENVEVSINYLADGGYMAKGGMVVTSIKDIPNFKQRLDEGKITYRGLGLGKLWDDFNKLTGTTGTRIKVDKKEYFITDEEFNTFSRGADGKLRIRFEAPFRKSYEEGGYMTESGKYYVLDAKDGRIVSKGFDTEEEAKIEKFRIFEMTSNPFLTQKKMEDGGYMAKGGDVFELYDINGKKIEEGDIVKSTQPSGGILSSSEGQIGIVEKTKDAFGQDDFQIRFKKEGRNFDQFILLNNKINEIIKKGDGKISAGGYMANGGQVRNIDKIKQNIGEEVYQSILHSDQKRLENRFKEINEEINRSLKFHRGERTLEYYKLKDEQWLILYRLERTSEFNYDDNIDYAKGGYMAKGGAVKVGERIGDWAITQYIPLEYENGFIRGGGSVKLVNQDDFETIFIQHDYALRGAKWFSRYKRVQYEGNTPNEVLKKMSKVLSNTMSMGGKVTFDDKVSSIKKSLLKKKTVSPKVQKDYGKTYNKKEALESAQRIAGAMRAKYKK
jgi:hypothetical protein